jgi:diadenosine tetraphosphate (Ap4A) HIT family hydrolase
MNVKQFSEEELKKNCPFCDAGSFAKEYPILETNNFLVACDSYPITEGHILIIPKEHISCIGEYDKFVFDEFLVLYKKFSDFIKNAYGSISTFEHGKTGQTVFHSHTHLLPYMGDPIKIVPEGKDKLEKIDDISELMEIFKKENKYLFFSIGVDKWVVDKSIGTPRFFRDRFAYVLGNSSRGNWKEMRNNIQLMKTAQEEIRNLELKWKEYSIK